MGHGGLANRHMDRSNEEEPNRAAAIALLDRLGIPYGPHDIDATAQEIVAFRNMVTGLAGAGAPIRDDLS